MSKVSRGVREWACNKETKWHGTPKRHLHPSVKQLANPINRWSDTRETEREYSFRFMFTSFERRSTSKQNYSFSDLLTCWKVSSGQKRSAASSKKLRSDCCDSVSISSLFKPTMSLALSIAVVEACRMPSKLGLWIPSIEAILTKKWLSDRECKRCKKK